MGDVVAGERVERGERLAFEAPALRGVRSAGERVGDRVEVGGDVQPVELVVVGGVDDGDDIARRDGAHEPGEETGGADTTGEGCEHAGKLLAGERLVSELRQAAEPVRLAHAWRRRARSPARRARGARRAAPAPARRRARRAARRRCRDRARATTVVRTWLLGAARGRRRRGRRPGGCPRRRSPAPRGCGRRAGRSTVSSLPVSSRRRVWACW